MNLKKLERYLRVNLLGPGPRLTKKKNLPGRGLTKVETHCPKSFNVNTVPEYLTVTPRCADRDHARSVDAASVA